MSILSSPTTSLLAIFLTALLFRALYRLSPFHPLSHIPGPALPRLSSLWLTYHSWRGDEASAVHAIHLRYGKTVCTGPNSVDIADGAALQAIYADRGGFRKPNFYFNFMVDGHRTIFSEIEPANRAPRAKAVLPIFSLANLRQGRGVVYDCARKWVEVMKMEAGLGGPVDILGLARSFAADAVCEYMLGISFGALDFNRAAANKRTAQTSREGKRVRADGMVDAFDAVGRYWYLPPWLYSWAEWVRLRFYADDAVLQTFGVMDAFVNRAMEAAISKKQDLAGTYQGRLLQAGFSERETKAQTMDVLFAGVDTTGINLATIVFNLARHPEKYDALRQEVLNADPAADVHSLPYLRGVVQEGLRISMANPTRLPRVVPQEGWCFEDVFFPGGVEVSCSTFELHNNADVFDHPRDFRPERWLTASKVMHRDHIPFGLGSRRCIAMNFALMWLCCAVHKLAEENVLAGAKCCHDRIELVEWFNSKVVDGTTDLIWE